MGHGSSLTLLSLLSPANLTSSWESPAPREIQDPRVPPGCPACLDPPATQATMAPRGPLGGRESQDPQARQEPWGHLVSLGLKDFQGLQAQLGQMDPQGHLDSQGLRVPPGCLGMKDPLVPQDLHHSLANQDSEGSQDSQDQR